MSSPRVGNPPDWVTTIDVSVTDKKAAGEPAAFC